ncbi:hypothetical protein VULLAG_LOCUS9667 [Vulpes lagopus]
MLSLEADKRSSGISGPVVLSQASGNAEDSSHGGLERGRTPHEDRARPRGNWNCQRGSGAKAVRRCLP